MFSPSGTSACRSRRITKLHDKDLLLCCLHISLPDVSAALCCSVQFLHSCASCRQLVFGHQACAMSLARTHWRNALQLLVCATRMARGKIGRKLDLRSCFVLKIGKDQLKIVGRDPNLAPFVSKCSPGSVALNQIVNT